MATGFAARDKYPTRLEADGSSSKLPAVTGCFRRISLDLMKLRVLGAGARRRRLLQLGQMGIFATPGAQVVEISGSPHALGLHRGHCHA